MIASPMIRRSSIRMDGERGVTMSKARGRIIVLSGVFTLAFCALGARALDLMVLSGDAYSKSHARKTGQMAADLPMRGDVRDRNGVLLATTLKTASLFVDPRYVADKEKTARALVRIFPDLGYGKVLQLLQSTKRFAWLRRNITPNEQYAVLEIGEPGLNFRYEQNRIYPHGELLAHLLGYTNIDNKGLAGVERSFDGMLSKGEAVDLTLDIRLQHALRREVLSAIDEFSANAGVGVIMDAKNGAILAGVSLPDFNPHKISKAKPDQMFNRLTLGVYELGSVFKIFSTAAFLETHNVPLSATFDVSEPIKYGRFTIDDYHGKDRKLTIPEVFMYSSNIGSAMMGESVGTQALHDFYADLGLLDPSEVEIGEVARPLVPDHWRDIHTLTASYGHGLATTPMQVVAAVASVVNGGLLVRPHLSKDSGSTEVTTALRIVSEDTSLKMRQMMSLVVTDGTGRKANVEGYAVGGKTGTAEKPKRDGKGYDKHRLISSFVGAFPIDDPRYVVLIAIDEPKGNAASANYATAGWVAAPVFSKVVTSMASILGIAPHQEPKGFRAIKRYVSEERRH